MPLYHCRCSICERATLSANLASGMAPNQPLAIVPPQLQRPLEVEIKQTEIVTLEEEEEEDDLTSITESTTDMVISKKRPSTDLDADGDTVESDEDGIRGRGGTPPKRARLKGNYSPTTIESLSPRMRKRSSEELEGLDLPVEQILKKRRTSPNSIYADSESIVEEDTTSGGEDVQVLEPEPFYPFS